MFISGRIKGYHTHFKPVQKPVKFFFKKRDGVIKTDDYSITILGAVIITLVALFMRFLYEILYIPIKISNSVEYTHGFNSYPDKEKYEKFSGIDEEKTESGGNSYLEKKQYRIIKLTDLTHDLLWRKRKLHKEP